MSEEAAVLTEDQSHYEISLTAGQAFVAFVLLLLSLAASFAFGLLIGKGQNDGSLALKKDAVVINEATVAPKKKVVDLPADDFKVTEAPPAAVQPQPVAAAPPIAPRTDSGGPLSSTSASTPYYAQLLSSTDQKVAESLAEKLIGAGFNTAYVERTASEKGTVFRVRVKFESEGEAKAAQAKLKEFSKDVWITSK
jgi:hypothetical protein